jgi:aryl-alcohol dehydrogenase-like predicted oxidoreductase
MRSLDIVADAIGRRAALRLAVAAGLAALMPSAAARVAKVERMSTRPIPSTGEALPVIGIGTWQTFDVGTSAAAREPLAAVLRLFFEAGGKVIDSSPMYGRAEDVAGALIAGLDARDHAFLATKVWTEGREAGIAQMRNSMRLMRAGQTIDLIQVHNLVDWRTHLETLRAWKEAGTVRYIGITHYTESAFDDLARVMRDERIDFVQLPYSVGVRAAEDRLLPLAAERGIAVIVNRPFEGGGLFRQARRQPLPDIAAELDCTSWAQLFLKFILAHPAVTCVIPGTGKVDHLVDNVGAGHGRLPDSAQRRRLLRAVEAL